jgi:hypothetical protein
MSVVQEAKSGRASRIGPGLSAKAGRLLGKGIPNRPTRFRRAELSDGIPNQPGNSYRAYRI